MSDKLKLRVQWDNIMQKVSNISTSWGNTPSDTKYPSEKLVKDSLDTKENTSNKTTTLTSSSTDTQYPSAKSVYDAIQDISPGGEVELDYYWDNTNKQLVLEYDNITQISGGGGGNVEIVTSWEQTLSDEKVPSEKLTKDTIDTKADSSDIPTKTSDLTNDGDGINAFLTQHQSLTNYVQKSSTTGLLKNDGTIMTSGTGSTNYALGNHTHSGYLNATKVTSWSSTVSDSNVPSEKLVKNYIDDQIGTAIQYIQQ